MKRIFKSLMFIAATAMALASCQTKEIETDYKGEAGDIHVIIKADGEVDYSDTKTAAVEGAEATYVKWLSTDKLDIWETPLGEGATDPKAFTSEVASNLRENDMLADFSVSFGGTATGEEFWYTAIYPAGAVTKSSSNFYRYKMPAKQKLSADGNFSADCDVMIGVPVRKAERVADGSTLEYSFRRPGTVVKLRLKGIHSGETINSITINAPAYITGFTKICIVPDAEHHIGEVYDFAYAEADQTSRNTLEIDGNGFVSDGDDDVWVRFNACTWEAGSSLSITVDTDEAVYTKSYENKLPKKFEFEEGGLTKFGFSFGESDREEKSAAVTYTLVEDDEEIVEGATYMFVGRSQSKAATDGTYYGFGALSGTLITPLQLVKITQAQSDPAPGTIEVDNTTAVYTSTFESAGSGKYYITYNDGYLKSGNKAISKVEKSSATAWSISIENSITTIGDGTYVISPNIGSQRFACYASIQSANFPYLYVDLSTVKSQLAAPSVSAVDQNLATAIKVTCAPVSTDKDGNALEGASLVYTLTVTGETDVDPIVLTGADLVEGQYVKTVSGLAYGSYVVNITASDANDKYRSNYGEANVELVQPELAAINDLVAVDNADEKKIGLVWSDVENADTYTIKNGETTLGSVAAGVGEYTISDIAYGQEYVLTVEASKTGYKTSVSNTETLTVTQPKVANPQIEVETNAAAATIYLVWADVEKATKYEVYNFTEKLAEVAAGVEEYTIENVEYDVFYEVSIKAINGNNANYLPGVSNTERVSIHNPAVIGTFDVIADASTPNSLSVDWDAAENATSYTVAYYNGEEVVASVSDLEETEYTFAGVDAGTYTVKVTASADGFDPRTESSESVEVRNARITYATVTGGTVSSTPQGNAKVGSTVTLSNEPSTGYEFVKYTKDGADLAEATFNIEADVEVGAVFQKINYTITKSGEYASNITVKKAGSVVETAQIDDVITIEAGSVSGKKFSSWTVNGATPESTTANPTTFTMGAGNVTVEANYEDKTTVTYTKVTSASGIVSGGVYLVVCEDQNTAMGSQNTNRRNAASVTISNNTIELEPTEVNVAGKPYEITLTKDGSIYYMRATGNYIGNNSTSNYLKETTGTTAGNQWNISYNTTTGRVVLQTNHATTRVLCVNTQNADPYATYTSDSSYGKVTLYKKAGDTPTPPPTPTSYTISLTQPTGGSIDAKVGGVTASSAVAGATVTLAVTSTPSGKTFSSWTVTKSKGGTVTVSNNQFEMPDDNVTVEASFTTSGGGEPTLKHTFTPSNTSGSSSPYSFTTAKTGTETAPAYTSSELRLYKGNKLTIGTTGATNITKIEIDFCKQGTKEYIESCAVNTGSYSGGGTSTSGTDVKTDTWTGAAKSIEISLNGNGKQRVVKEIRIYEN